MEDVGKDISPLVLNTEAVVLKEGLFKKDHTTGSKDYKKMLKANNARNEESATLNSTWSPGALKRATKAAKLTKKRKL